MKVVIMAGGLGSRLSEETVRKPKPMVEIGEKPIIWHIMKIYSHYGFHEFIICCGYKGAMIKEYFIHYYMHQSDVSYHLENSRVTYQNSAVEPWKITLVNTGLHTLTAGRLLRARPYIGGETFMLTYGDGVADINLSQLLNYHKSHGRCVTISSTLLNGRFGILQMEKETGQVTGFREKMRRDQGWSNIGFMVMEPEVFDYLGDGSQMLEGKPFHDLVYAGQMMSYRHEGFWAPMDNMRDRASLETMWEGGSAPWNIWKEVDRHER